MGKNIHAMKSGGSADDVPLVVNFCKALYRKCRQAGEEYNEISWEVKDLYTVLRHLNYEVESDDSPLHQDHSIWARQVAPIVVSCDTTLQDLEALLRKYRRISSPKSGSSSEDESENRRRPGSHEMDALGAIRVKLISHRTSLTRFLDTIQLHQNEQLQEPLDNSDGQLDDILDKVDAIAARMGQGNRSIMAIYDDEDTEVWKQFRKELVAEGFSNEVLANHKDVLRAYIREIDQNGLLDGTPAQQSTIAAGGKNQERWLEAVQPASVIDPLPPTFSSLNMASSNLGDKEVVVHGENTKYPPSIKMARPQAETIKAREPQHGLGLTEGSRTIKSDTSRLRQPSPIPRLITTHVPHSHEKRDIVLHHSSSAHSDSEAESSRHLGLVILTSDLLAATRAFPLSTGSPLSFRSQSSFGGSYDNNASARSLVHRPKDGLVPAVEYGSSAVPLAPGALSVIVPRASEPSSGASFAASPSKLRSGSSFKLAPDSQGNDIPSDAKWTKVKRHLISTEVLEQDHRRYEATPDFVAILGVLSRAEIEAYVLRSHDIREARRRRSRPSPNPTLKPSLSAQSVPQQSATAMPIPTTGAAPRRAHFARDTTPSTSDSGSSASDSENTDSDHKKRKQQKRRDPRRHVSSNGRLPVSGYPNPYGSPLTPVGSVNHTRDVDSDAPARDRDSAHGRAKERPRSHNHQHRESDRERDIHPHDRDGGRDRGTHRDADERERARDGQHHSRRSHHHHHRGHSSKDGHTYTSTRSQPPPTAKQIRSSRWKENLTAAGIGGAAVSLFNVLSEAAEEL